jgi:hypothetical protein
MADHLSVENRIRVVVCGIIQTWTCILSAVESTDIFAGQQNRGNQCCRRSGSKSFLEFHNLKATFLGSTAFH